MRSLAAGMIAVMLGAGSLAAQGDGLERLDPDARAAIRQIVDSARAAGLPTAPLISKAQEGASKRAPGNRIVAVVRAHARALETARRALGDGADEVELIAAAGALQAGVAMSQIRELGAVRRETSLAVPLVVLADLAARGVPADTAAAAVLGMWRGGASSSDFIALRSRVEQDIRSGAPPAASTTLRARAFPMAPRVAEPSRSIPPPNR